MWNREEIPQSIDSHNQGCPRPPTVEEDDADGESESDKEGVPSEDEKCEEDQSETGRSQMQGKRQTWPQISLSCPNVDVWPEDLPVWTWLIWSTFSSSEHWS